jgi:hypothetical protein
MYALYVHSLSNYLRLAVSSWVPKEILTDDWQTSAWEKSQGYGKDDGSGTGQARHFS